MREHVIDFGKQHVITKDTVQIMIDALVVSGNPCNGGRVPVPHPVPWCP